MKPCGKVGQVWSQPRLSLNPTSTFYLYGLGHIITSLGLDFLICKEKVITTYLTGLLGEVNEPLKVKHSAQCLAQNQLLVNNTLINSKGPSWPPNLETLGPRKEMVSSESHPTHFT